MENKAELEALVAEWADCSAKAAFLSFRQALEAVSGAVLEFKARPGITYSLRGLHPGRAERPLFALIDVIDDDPDVRWLSVCFYEGTVTDPGRHGDWIPQGILGEDARCFNVDEEDDELVAYVAERIREAGAGSQA
jgi:hypothetical protein